MRLDPPQCLLFPSMLFQVRIKRNSVYARTFKNYDPRTLFKIQMFHFWLGGMWRYKEVDITQMCVLLLFQKEGKRQSRDTQVILSRSFNSCHFLAGHNRYLLVKEWRIQNYTLIKFTALILHKKKVFSSHEPLAFQNGIKKSTVQFPVQSKFFFLKY